MPRVGDLTFRHLCTLLLLVLLASVLPANARHAAAQPPVDEPDGARRLFLPQLGASPDGAVSQAEEAEVDAAGQQGGGAAPLRLLVDADPGVDDATALLWLLRQRIRPITWLGVVTVAGNTDLFNATNNVLTLLEVASAGHIPVVMGAAAPLVQPLSKTGYFVHGPDGLWLQGLANPHDLRAVPQNAADFYCATLAANPGATLLALGPLTNLALALERCPEEMQTLASVVVLGGAKAGGNKTPVAEFNFWQDPEAAEAVLGAGLPVRLVPYDAFVQPTVELREVERLAASRDAATQFLAPALVQYVNVQLQNTGRATLPDAVAAVLAISPAEGRSQPGLVKLVLSESLARGQSVIGLAASERIAMLATDAELSELALRAFAYPPDPNFNLPWELGAILMREPDNADVVTAVPPQLLARRVISILRK